MLIRKAATPRKTIGTMPASAPSWLSSLVRIRFDD